MVSKKIQLHKYQASIRQVLGKAFSRGWQAYAKGLPYSRHNCCSIVLRYFFDSSSMVYRTTIGELSNNYRRNDMASPWETHAISLTNTCHILACYGSNSTQIGLKGIAMRSVLFVQYSTVANFATVQNVFLSFFCQTQQKFHHPLDKLGFLLSIA